MMMMMIIRMLYLSIVGITTADAFHVAVGVTQQRLFRSSRTNSQLYQVSTTTTKSNTPLFGR